jgi:hypothetical protein
MELGNFVIWGRKRLQKALILGKRNIQWVLKFDAKSIHWQQISLPSLPKFKISNNGTS